jgi:glycosyltransferase involved in cell wall biosynthesis
MRLLVATDAWHPQINGVVRTLDTVVGELRRRGHEVEVVKPADFATMPLPSYPEIRLAFASAAALGRHIDRFRPDAIHVATEGPVGRAARRAALRRGLAFTTSYHTRFPEYLSARLPVPERLTYALLRRFHNAAAAVMVATPTLAGELVGRGFTNIVPWSRGVDTQLFRPEASLALDLPRPVFLSVGRVAVEKNLEAFLSLDLPGTRLVVGDGPARASLQARFPKAVFVGSKVGAELAAFYASADVFVFPSRTDTFGLVLLEALASGLPVAAFPVPGPLDVVGSGVPGAQAVAALSEDLRGACLAALRLDRAACRAFAEARSWSACTDQFLGHLVRVDGRMASSREALPAL